MNMAKRCWVHYEAFEYGDEPPSESHVEVPDTDALQARLTRLEAALQSIAKNSCCGSCQEAALVAEHALAEPQGGGEG